MKQERSKKQISHCILSSGMSQWKVNCIKSGRDAGEVEREEKNQRQCKHRSNIRIKLNVEENKIENGYTQKPLLIHCQGLSVAVLYRVMSEAIVHILIIHFPNKTLYAIVTSLLERRSTDSFSSD